MALSPDVTALTMGSIAALLLAHAALTWQRRRIGHHGGLFGAARNRAACAAASVLAAAVAIGFGADPLVAAVAASATLAAYAAALPSVAAVALLTGVAGEAILLDGVPRATGELLVGLGLVVAGLACRALERREP